MELWRACGHIWGPAVGALAPNVHEKDILQVLRGYLKDKKSVSKMYYQKWNRSSFFELNNDKKSNPNIKLLVFTYGRREAVVYS